MILTFDDIITAEEHAKILDHVEKGTFIDGKATAYVCEDYVCRLPTTLLPALFSPMPPPRAALGTHAPFAPKKPRTIPMCRSPRTRR